MAALLRWRMVMGDGLAGRFRPVGRLGLECGRNPCRLRPRRGDTCGCHHSFLKGVGGIHPHLPPRVRGNLRTRPGSSVIGVHPFLEVLLGTRRIGALVCGDLCPVGAAVPGHPRFAKLP